MWADLLPCYDRSCAWRVYAVNPCVHGVGHSGEASSPSIVDECVGVYKAKCSYGVAKVGSSDVPVWGAVVRFEVHAFQAVEVRHYGAEGLRAASSLTLMSRSVGVKVMVICDMGSKSRGSISCSMSWMSAICKPAAYEGRLVWSLYASEAWGEPHAFCAWSDAGASESCCVSLRLGWGHMPFLMSI